MKSILFLLLFLCSTSIAAAVETLPRPYREILDTPTTFTGIKRGAQSSKEIVLSFLLPSEKIIAKIIRQASLQAVRKANDAGGYKGIPFTVVYRLVDSPWKAGPGEVIKLVYENNATVLITSFSAESHIATQIAAKSFLPVISLFSGDATLNQARLPWIFRLVPDHQTQLELLAKDSLHNGVGTIGLISTINQESRLAANEGVKVFKQAGLKVVFHHQLKSEHHKWPELGRIVARNMPDALLLCTSRTEFMLIAEKLRTAGIHCPLYLTWTPGLKFIDIPKIYAGKIVTVSPVQSAGCSVNSNANPSRGDVNASALFSLAYDGTQFAIDAIRLNGPQSSELGNSLKAMKSYNGRYTTYHFDNGGGNTTTPHICIYNNLPHEQ